MENKIVKENFNELHANLSPFTFATFGKRIIASILDTFIVMPIVALHLYNLITFKILFFSVVLNLIGMFYKSLMEHFYGATLGKMAIRIKVIERDGSLMSLEVSLLRNIIYLLNAAIGIYLLFVLFNHSAFLEITSLEEYLLFVPNFKSIELFQSTTSTLLVISVIFIFFNHENQTFHDKLANTYVIEDKDGE